MERVEEKEPGGGQHCKHMSPSSARRARAPGTPPGAPRPGGSPAAQPSRGPPCQRPGSAPLPLRSPPPSHGQAPQDHIVGPNTMECHSPELLGGPPRPKPSPPRHSRVPMSRVQPRTQTSPCERPGSTREVTEPRIPPSPPTTVPPTSPGREPRTGRSHPPPRPPQGSPRPPPGRGVGGEGRETRGGLPARPGPDPWAVLQRGEGPGRIPGLSRPTDAPPPTLPTWP